MASILEVKDGFIVRYDYYDENGVRHQPKPKFKTWQTASKFKKKVEELKRQGKDYVPVYKTVKEAADEFIKIYGAQNWRGKTYDDAKSLITNHILKEIGDINILDITTEAYDNMIHKISMKKSGHNKYMKLPVEERPPMAQSTFRWICILANQIFEFALDRDWIYEMPTKGKLPNNNNAAAKKTAFWLKNEMDIALNIIQDSLLHLGVHSALMLTLRVGEVTGICWDCINFNTGRILIDRSIQRMSLEAIENTRRNEIIRIFPVKTSKKTRLVLKAVKTDAGNRGQLIPAPLLEEFILMKEHQDLRKKIDPEYKDYDLVFALPNGDPIEPHLMSDWFTEWVDNEGILYGLTKITFHGLRHTSITYKASLTNDLSAIQSQSGHASLESMLPYLHQNNPASNALTNALVSDFYSAEDIAKSNSVLEKKLQGIKQISKPQKKQVESIEDSLIGGLLGNSVLDTVFAAIKKDPQMQKKVLLAALTQDGINF